NFPLPISNLQLGLIVGGVLLVLGVIIYNHWQERRVRRRIESAFRPTEEKESARVEPTLGSAPDAGEASVMRTHRAAPVPTASPTRATPLSESTFVPPMDVIEHENVGTPARADEAAVATAYEAA